MAVGVRYLALIRGINVGGKNIVRMADLRDALSELEVEDVRTHIQSGNVLFRAPRQKRDELATELESELSSSFGIEIKVVLLSRSQLEAVVAGAPRGFGAETHRCDVIFVRKPLTAKRAFGVLKLRDGVDRAWQGRGVVYFSRLTAEAAKSQMGKVVAMPEYQNMTIRSWSTVTKLEALMADGPG
jgi:uncharacterized protein (DUF1697 family)